MQPLVIAHRGASGEAPENTIRAFDLARTQGADMIELDVQKTVDGALVIFHDDTTKRWNGRPDAIEQLTAQQIRELRIDSEPVVTLDELCDWARSTGMPLNVEIKSRGIEAPVAEALRRFGLVEQVLVSSFYPDVLVRLRAVAPELRRAALMGTESWHPTIRIREAWPIWSLRRLQAVAWHPAVELPFLARVTPLIRRRGYAVNVWTVNNPATMQRLIALGVDGIITNYPARLRALLAN